MSSDGAKGQGKDKKAEPNGSGNGDAETTPEPTDDLVTTTHQITTGDGVLRYTATTGRVVLRKEVHTDGAFDGHLAKAEVFFTAYTRTDDADGTDGAVDPATRPVTFAFNGGPGSSSVWLHLGLLGPRRVLSGDVDDRVPPPYGIADNAETLLAHSDLVFIDPVSTGFSRAAKGEKPADFHGFTGDLESVGEVIRLWLTRNGRWLSPKYLAGESYGTLRAAGLTNHLMERYGIYLNGVMLISSVLDLGSIHFTEGNEVPYVLFLPTYAAVAHYHGLHGDRPLAEVLAEAEEFAERDYPWALARGARLSDEQRADAVTTLARLSGLSADYVDRIDLRPEHVRFFTELLRERRQVVGRLDSRAVGWDPDAARETFDDDPSYQVILGPYTAAINHYLHTELGYANDLPYEILSSRVQPWSYKEFEGASVSVAERLAAAMRANPHMRVYVASGYYDGATPYYAAEHVLAHLRIPAHLRENIQVEYYPAGHMMYLHEPSRRQQSADLAAFVRNLPGAQGTEETQQTDGNG